MVACDSAVDLFSVLWGLGGGEAKRGCYTIHQRAINLGLLMNML